MHSRAIGWFCLSLLGCAGQTDEARNARYLSDRAFRRAELERSLVTHDNGYADVRLDRYANQDGWDALDEFNPEVRPITLDDVGRFARDPAATSAASFARVYTERAPGEWTEEALIELGRRAFETYPVQLNRTVGGGVDDMLSVRRYGLSVDDRGHIGGLVRVRLPSGVEQFAVTCATCHARAGEDGVLEHGAASRFDWGALAHREASRNGADPASVAPLLEWGPGRVDVTPDGVDNPVAMSDLRALSRQPYLHWSATIYNGLIALAIRIETLMITSMGESARPPRAVSLGIALYLWSLGDVGAEGDADGQPEGAALFTDHCANCHAADGVPHRGRVRIDVVGTDARVGESRTRGTGYYRVPSLWGIAGRSPLLHDASALSVRALLDPRRAEAGLGHEYGTALSEPERDALTAFVLSIGRP